MWVPTSAAEVEQAVAGGQLVETRTFDGKALPGKNKDIAIDVCAMTPDGGSLLYGVGEDKNHRLTVFRPFPLVGEPERIDQVVATSIVEVPFIVINELPTDADPTVGYISVGIPQSNRAPHQVIVGNDMRYYGRGATGNRLLSEGEVARLYARREKWEIDREALLDGESERWQELVPTSSEFGYLYAFARPVDAEADLLEMAAGGNDVGAVLDGLLSAGRESAVNFEPSLRRSPLSWHRSGAEGWELRHEEEPSQFGHLVQIDVERNGHCHLFCDRAAERFREELGGERLVIFEQVILGCLASLLAVGGELYRTGGYIGAVDIGVYVGNLIGGLSFMHRGPLGWHPPYFTRDDFRNTERIATASELAEHPRELAMKLTRRLVDATMGREFDPWAES